MPIANIVARITARITAGPELCRNPEWQRLIVDTTINAMKAAQIIRFVYPPRWRWLSRWFFSGSRNVNKGRKAAARLLAPIIEKRKAAIKDGAEKPRDGVQWLLDHKDSGRKSLQEIADDELFLSIASIHTTAGSFLSILYDLL